MSRRRPDRTWIVCAIGVWALVVTLALGTVAQALAR